MRAHEPLSVAHALLTEILVQGNEVALSSVNTSQVINTPQVRDKCVHAMYVILLARGRSVSAKCE